ncbi:RidA family protein [Bosea lathyri]|nr:RidA family protein [Bosea lathyri]
MTSILRHNLPSMPPSVSPSSHAVEADGLVFLTGQFGRDLKDPEAPLPPGIAAQTRRTLQNMRSCLADLGLDMRNVVSVRVFLTEFKRDYDEMNQAYAEFFEVEHRPTRTCVGVTSIVRDALVEIDCIAKR